MMGRQVERYLADPDRSAPRARTLSSRAVRHNALVIALLALTPCAAGAAEPKGGEDKRVLEALVEAHNRERAKEKLPPLTANAQLEAAAQAHARDMAEQKKMSHTGSDDSTPADRIKKTAYRYVRVAENVAVEYKDVEAVMRGWTESPPHKKTILGEYTEMGGAVARDEDGRRYWCVVFGTPLPPKPNFTAETAETALIEALNAERKKAGRAGVKRNRTLSEAAQRHAKTLAAQDKIVAKDDDEVSALDRVEKAGYRYRRLAEEIASGLDTPKEVVQAWLERPTDRDNVLGEFSEVGVGYAVAGSERTYWCVIFGRPAR